MTTIPSTRPSRNLPNIPEFFSRSYSLHSCVDLRIISYLFSRSAEKITLSNSLKAYRSSKRLRHSGTNHNDPAETIRDLAPSVVPQFPCWTGNGSSTIAAINRSESGWKLWIFAPHQQSSWDIRWKPRWTVPFSILTTHLILLRSIIAASLKRYVYFHN